MSLECLDRIPLAKGFVIVYTVYIRYPMAGKHVSESNNTMKGEKDAEISRFI